MISKLDKVKCFLGVHQMQPVKYLDSIIKRKSSFLRYTRKCNCCNRDELYSTSSSHWDGRQSEVEKVWYIGDYNIITLLKRGLRRFK